VVEYVCGAVLSVLSVRVMRVSERRTNRGTAGLAEVEYVCGAVTSVLRIRMMRVSERRTNRETTGWNVVEYVCGAVTSVLSVRMMRVSERRTNRETTGWNVVAHVCGAVARVLSVRVMRVRVECHGPEFKPRRKQPRILLDTPQGVSDLTQVHRRGPARRHVPQERISRSYRRPVAPLKRNAVAKPSHRHTESSFGEARVHEQLERLSFGAAQHHLARRWGARPPVQDERVEQAHHRDPAVEDEPVGVRQEE